MVSFLKPNLYNYVWGVCCLAVLLFSSNSLENIGVAKDRLVWGFWDREAGEKQRKNWRQFIKLYNQIKPFDVVVFQMARTGKIHAVGLVKERFYDDQTPTNHRLGRES